MPTPESQWSRDLGLLSAMIQDSSVDDPALIMPWGVFDGLAELIPCEQILYAEMDVRKHQRLAHQMIDGDHRRYFSIGDESGSAGEDVYWQHRGTFWAAAPPRPVGGIWRWSEYYSRRQLQCQPLYAEYFGPLGLRHFMTVEFPAPAGFTRHLQFFRFTDCRFSDREKQLLMVLRPYLYELHGAALRRRTTLPRLTPREWQVLELVAQGADNVQVARVLNTSVSTVRKHLEHIYQRSGVRTRSAAVARMLPIVPSSADPLSIADPADLPSP